MKSLPILVCAALFALGCGNNVVSSNPSSSTGGSTATGGSGSTGTSATDGSSNTTSTSVSGGTTGSDLPRPTYPSPPSGQNYAVTINHVISNYTFHGYVKPSSGAVINTVTGFNTFSLQDIRNLTDANGKPFRYLLLDFAAGYVQRALSTLPRQGEHAPWLMSMDYYMDVKLLRHAEVADPNLKFSKPARPSAQAYSDAAATV